MPRHIHIGLVVMACLTVASTIYFVSVARSVRSTPETLVPDTPFQRETEPLYSPTDPPVDVKLFFPAASNDVLLRTRTMTIFASESAANRARQIVEHLVGGGEEAIFDRLPAETRLSQVFVSDLGIAYLDFNSALADNHPGGVLREQATIYSIVNSLVYNLEEVDRVKILIGGIEKETLAGHCLLLLPLGADLSITDIASTEELSAIAEPAP